MKWGETRSFVIRELKTFFYTIDNQLPLQRLTVEECVAIEQPIYVWNEAKKMGDQAESEPMNHETPHMMK